MIIFTPNTVIKSADVNTNYDDLDTRLAVLETAPVRAVLTSNFTSTTTQAYQDTGLKVTLPDAGSWIIHCDLRFGNANNTGDFGSFRLYNQTTSTAITNSDRLPHYIVASEQNTAPLTDLVTTTTANNIIRVEIRPGNARTHQLLADTNGYSVMIARRYA